MTEALPITDDELPALFAGFERWPLALAVSGGADSMALMHLVARWAARDDVRAAWAERTADFFAPRRDDDRWWPPVAASNEALPTWLGGIDTLDELRRTGGPPHVVVLTVDHGLRPEAAEEAAFVAREAARLGLPCQILHWNGEKPSTGIQNAAREARRALMLGALAAESQLFDDIAKREGVRLGGFRRSLVMAHHMEDQAETFLMRLARGSGLEGLGGMLARDTDTRKMDWGRQRATSATLMRPLLAVPKARLLATLRAQGAKWVDDPSNGDERFERVRIRNVMRDLESLGFTAEKIALSARRLGDARFGLLALSADGSRRLLQNGDLAGLCAEIDLTAEVWQPWFAGPYNSARTLRQIIRSYGGAADDAELSQLESLERQLSVWRRTQAIAAGLTLGGCKVEFHGEGAKILRVYREGSGEGLPVVTILPGQAVDWDGARFTIEAEASAATSAEIRALGMSGWAELKRNVPEFADLRWPAAAAATLPVVARDGAIVAYPVIDHLLRTVESFPGRPRDAWARFAATLEPGFKAGFNVAPW